MTDFPHERRSVLQPSALDNWAVAIATALVALIAPRRSAAPSLVKETILSMSTTTWPGATPRRADNVELAPRISEDWLSLIIGLFIFVLALAGIANVDLLGWVVTTSVWSDVGQGARHVSKSYASLGGFGALVATYVALLVVLSAAAVALKSDITKFALAFTAVFWIAYASWVVGNYANFAAVTPAELQKFGISWSLKLTNEGGYIFALIAGLIIANFFPRFAEAIKEAVRPELYIKIAIVILGGFFAVTAAGKLVSRARCCCAASPPSSRPI